MITAPVQLLHLDFESGSLSFCAAVQNVRINNKASRTGNVKDATSFFMTV